MRARRRTHLGRPFWGFTILAILVALIAMNGGYNLLFWVFGVMTASILISGIVSGGMLVHLGVTRVISEHGTVGQPLALRYRLHNRSRLFPAFSMHLEERPMRRERRAWNTSVTAVQSWVMHVGPRETVHGEALIVPMQRGRLEFDRVRVWTVFPFGLVRKSITFRQRQHAVIYPRLYGLQRHVLARITPTGGVGMRVTQHAGAGDDYYGLREYREGDSMRQVAWKRTANRDQLLCVERTRPNPPRLRIVVDLRAPTEALRVGADEAFTRRDLEERAISLAASIIHAADLGEYEIGLTILGFDDEPIPVRRNHWHRTRLMAMLAEIDLDAPRSDAVITPSALEVVGEAAGLVVVHPDRADLALGRRESWHFTARQLDHLVDPATDPDGAAMLRQHAAAQDSPI